MKPYKSKIKNKRIFDRLPAGQITEIECRCPWTDCGKKTVIRVAENDLVHYLGSLGSVEDCFPYLSSMQREQVRSGYCEEHERLLFGPFMPLEAQPLTLVGRWLRSIRNFFYTNS